MAITDKNTIISWFQTGDFPTSAQFNSAWDSFWHKDENIPMTKITGLNQQLQSTATSTQVNAKANKDASNIDIETWKETLGVTNIPTNIATIDEGEDIGTTYNKTQIDNLMELNEVTEKLILANEKELEIINLNNYSAKKSAIYFNGKSYIVSKHLGGCDWLEIILTNSGEIASGVMTPFKIVSKKVKKITGYLLHPDGVKTGTWTDYTSDDASVYVGHKSSRTSVTNDKITFIKNFGGNLELQYIGRTDGGIFKVMIDGVDYGNVDTYSAVNNSWKKTVTIAENLDLASHTVELINTGIKNSSSTGFVTWFNCLRIIDSNALPNSSFIKLKEWKTGESVLQYDERIGLGGKIYMAQSSGITGANKPSHANGSASDGAINWLLLANSSFESDEFPIMFGSSEEEYAYQIKPNVNDALQDVGGNLHGNEFLKEAVEIVIDNSKTTIQQHKFYFGETIQIKQKIEDFYGVYTTKTPIADVEHCHTFNKDCYQLNVDFTFLTSCFTGYFYSAMLPFITYEAQGYRGTFNILATPTVSYNLLDYQSVNNNPILGNEKDFIAYAIGNSYIKKSANGVISEDLGKGKVLIAVKCDSKGLRNYNNSNMYCGLAVNTNNGQYGGYSSWASKIYFELASANNSYNFSQGEKLSLSNRYYVKLF